MSAIETEQDITDLENKLKLLVTQRDPVAINTVTKLVNDLIISEIKNRMRAANYSPRIIDALKLDRVWIVDDEAFFRISNSLIVGAGFDIAIGMEEGINPHRIDGSPLLAFPGSTIIGDPATVIVRSVQHPGVIGTHIIKDTIDENLDNLQVRYLQLQDAWESETLS